MESQAALPRIRTGLDREDSKELRNMATIRVVLKNLVVEVCRALPGTACPVSTARTVADNEAVVVVVESTQASGSAPKAVSADDVEAGSDEHK